MAFDYEAMSQDQYDAMIQEWRNLTAARLDESLNAPNPLLTALRSRV